MAEVTREDIDAACAEEGIEIMAQVFGIVLNREQLHPNDVGAYLDRFSAYEVYERFIGPAIDRVEDDIRREIT